MRLTPKNITQWRRGLKKQNILIAQGRMTPEARQQSFNSWRGYAEKYDSHTSVERLAQRMNFVNGGRELHKDGGIEKERGWSR